MKKLIGLLAVGMAMLSVLADDVYGPFGSDGNLAENVQQLAPTVYDVVLTIKGKAAVPGDCLAAYRTSDGALCGLGMAYDSGNGVVKCDFVLRSYKDATIHFKAWQCSTPATEDMILDVDSSCDIVAPEPGDPNTPMLILFVPSRTFTVKFDKNGGTGTMADQKFTEDVEQALKKNEFKKSRYMFVGWKDQDGNEYDDEEALTPTSDLTLAAQWEAIVVSCAPNVATYAWRGTEDDPLVGEFDVACNTDWVAMVSDPTWMLLFGTEGDGNGTVEYGLTENDVNKPRTGTITVTSKIDGAVKATFTVDQQARPAAPDVIVEDGVLLGVDMHGYDRLDVPFGVTSIGFEAVAGNDEVRSIRIPASVAEIGDGAFAGCSCLTNVVFDGDAPSAGDGIFADTPEDLVVTVRNDKTGWPEEGSKWPTDDADGRAVVVLKNYIVSFDWNGWDAGPAIEDAVVEPGETIELPYYDLWIAEVNAWNKKQVGVRLGYTFGGWNESGSADDPHVEWLYEPTGSVALKAIWHAHGYNFKFDANGGKPTTQTTYQNIGEEWWMTIEEPTLANAEFDGWWTAKTGGERVDLDDVCSIVGDEKKATTIYAHWRKMFKATVKDGTVANGVAAPTKDITVLSGTELHLAAVDKSGNNMEFAKWTFTPSTANLGANFNPRDPNTSFLMPNAAVTLTANYIAKPGYVSVFAYEVNETLNEDDEPQGIEWSDDGKVWSPVGEGNDYPVKAGKSVAIQFRSTDPRWTVPAKVNYLILEDETTEIEVAATRVSVVEVDAEQEQYAASGTVTMSPKNGQALSGKPVALTAKPGKDTVFAYWTVNGEKVGYTATFKYAPDMDSTVTAVFRLKSAVEDPVLDANAIVPSANAMVGVAFKSQVPLAAAAYPAKFSAKGLPAGLKIDAASGVISGVPTKAGSFAVTVTAAGGVNTKAKPSVTIPITIKPLPAWAQGTFTGYCSAGDGEHDTVFGSASLTVSAAGKVSGKMAYGGTSWTLKADSYATVEILQDGGDGIETNFVLNAVATAGKVTRKIDVHVRSVEDSAPNWSGALINAKAEGASDYGEWSLALWRSLWKDKSTAAAAKIELAKWMGVYTLSMESDDGCGSGYLSLTVGKDGTVKATGKLADGKSLSATSPLMYDDAEDTWFAYLYAAPSAYKGGCFAAMVGFEGDGRDEVAAPNQATVVLTNTMSIAQWTSHDPQATEEYGMGFVREIAFFGAYYDKLKKLNDYYESLLVEMDEAPLLSYTYKETYFDENNRKTSESWREEIDAADTLGQAGMTVAVNEKGALVVAKATKPVQDRETKEWSYNGVNDGALTLSFKQATGIFKGSYTFWYDYPSAYDDTTEKETWVHTSKKVSFEGIMVQGENEMRGFYLWDASSTYDDPKTGKEKTYKYKESYPVYLVRP